MLDPVMSLTVAVELKPNFIVTFAFVTVRRLRRAATALALTTKYGTMPTVKMGVS